MTDARYPDRWLTDRRVRRLSDRAHRVFVLALTWSASNRTDGWLDPSDLPDIHPAAPTCVEELVAAGLLAGAGVGWLLVDFPLTQSSRAQMESYEQYRLRERHRKARKRAEAKAVVRADVPPDSPAERPADDRGNGKSKAGKDGSGDYEGGVVPWEE